MCIPGAPRGIFCEKCTENFGQKYLQMDFIRFGVLCELFSKRSWGRNKPWCQPQISQWRVNKDLWYSQNVSTNRKKIKKEDKMIFDNLMQPILEHYFYHAWNKTTGGAVQTASRPLIGCLIPPVALECPPTGTPFSWKTQKNTQLIFFSFILKI